MLERTQSNLSSPAPTPRSGSNASPSPFRPIENFVPSTLAQSVRDKSPNPTTSIRASVPDALTLSEILNSRACA